MMKFNVIFGFITLAVLFSTSTVSANPDITGTWYVHSLRGSIWVNHPKIQSWNFTITKAQENNRFEGVYVWVDAKTKQSTVGRFDATLEETERSFGDYKVRTKIQRDVILSVKVDAEDKRQDWSAIDDDGFDFGTLEVFREPSENKIVTVHFGDDGAFCDDGNETDEEIDRQIDEDVYWEYDEDEDQYSDEN